MLSFITLYFQDLNNQAQFFNPYKHSVHCFNKSADSAYPHQALQLGYMFAYRMFCRNLQNTTQHLLKRKWIGPNDNTGKFHSACIC